jgi:O-acetyl-ADP-ribose deacetylase (regulator of RNase III)
VWHGGRHGEERLLRSCYQSSFALALVNGVRSIAFPCISTGVYGYPKDQAAGIALEAMRSHEERFERIIACCFSEGDAEHYRRVLAEPL